MTIVCSRCGGGHMLVECRLEPKTIKIDHDDSDETEGRRLYRARADALAKSQVAMGKRRFKIAEYQEKPNDDPGRPVPKHGSGP